MKKHQPRTSAKHTPPGMAHSLPPVDNQRHQKGLKNLIQDAREMRENLTEEQIDKIIEDTFPASDPPGWY